MATGVIATWLAEPLKRLIFRTGSATLRLADTALSRTFGWWKRWRDHAAAKREAEIEDRANGAKDDDEFHLLLTDVTSNEIWLRTLSLMTVLLSLPCLFVFVRLALVPPSTSGELYLGAGAALVSAMSVYVLGRTLVVGGMVRVGWSAARRAIHYRREAREIDALFAAERARIEAEEASTPSATPLHHPTLIAAVLAVRGTAITNANAVMEMVSLRAGGPFQRQDADVVYRWELSLAEYKRVFAIAGEDGLGFNFSPDADLEQGPLRVPVSMLDDHLPAIRAAGRSPARSRA